MALGSVLSLDIMVALRIDGEGCEGSEVLECLMVIEIKKESYDR